MRKTFTILFLTFVLLFGGRTISKAQTTLQTVDFETAGSGYTITGEVAPNASYCWARTDGTVITPSVAFTGKQGTYFFYGENTDGTSGNTQIPVYVTLSSVNVSLYNNFQVKLLVAGNNDVLAAKEKTEYLKIEYAFDGGSFNTRTQFIAPFVNATYYAEDTNVDGTTDGASLSPTFTEFTYSIPGTGNNLQVRIQVNTDQGNEEVGFDNIRVLGTVAASSPTVTTQAVSSIAATTATGNGNITSLGVPNPTAYGVCWNTTGTPTISDSKVDKGAASATGTFTASMTDLIPNTTYYVRAYATNTASTSYSAGDVSFTTSALAPTVSSVSVPPNATYIVGQNLNFTVNFSEAVTVNTGGGTPYIPITLTTGGTVNAAYISGSGTTA
ncbi:MAG: hypothetical protein ACOYN4_21425, partial [Bacteroidales bacterium]